MVNEVTYINKYTFIALIHICVYIHAYYIYVNYFRAITFKKISWGLPVRYHSDSLSSVIKKGFNEL